MPTINLYDAKNKFRKVDTAEDREVISIPRHKRAGAKLVTLHHGEQARGWSKLMRQHLDEASYDPEAFMIDRSDLLEPEERDLL